MYKDEGISKNVAKTCWGAQELERGLGFTNFELMKRRF